MLSIIVSSCDKTNLANLTQSIEQSVGIEHEIIVIENPGRYSLTEAYNIGGSRAKYPYLLFVHEDVFFRTQDWGQILTGHLDSLDRAGVVGIAGTSYKPFNPSGWSFDRSGPLAFNLIQRFKHTKVKAVSGGVNNDSIKKMVCLDGVFLAVKRSIFDEIGFDETVGGFHCYDTDFCLRVAQKYQNYFIPDILIEHLSEGNLDDRWVTGTYRNAQKWRHVLPLSAEGSREVDLECELSAFDFFLDRLFNSSLGFTRKLGIIASVTAAALRKTRSPRVLKALGYSIKRRRQFRPFSPT